MHHPLCEVVRSVRLRFPLTLSLCTVMRGDVLVINVLFFGTDCGWTVPHYPQTTTIYGFRLQSSFSHAVHTTGNAFDPATYRDLVIFNVLLSRVTCILNRHAVGDVRTDTSFPGFDYIPGERLRVNYAVLSFEFVELVLRSKVKKCHLQTAILGIETAKSLSVDRAIIESHTPSDARWAVHTPKQKTLQSVTKNAGTLAQNLS